MAFGVEGISESFHRKMRIVEVVAGYKARRYARRLRNGHPGLFGSAEGSTNPMVCWIGKISNGDALGD